MPARKQYRVTLARKPYDRARIRTGRGWDVRVNGSTVGSVSPLMSWGSHQPNGWYFVVSSDSLGIPRRNTCGERGVPEDDVKKSAVAYVKACLVALKESGDR